MNTDDELIQSLAKQMGQSSSFNSQPSSAAEQPQQQELDDSLLSGRRSSASGALKSVEQSREHQESETQHETQNDELMLVKQEADRLRRENANLKQEIANAKLLSDATENKVEQFKKKTTEDFEQKIKAKDEQLDELSRALGELKARCSSLETEAASRHEMQNLQSPATHRDVSMEQTRNLRKRLGPSALQLKSPAEMRAQIGVPMSPHRSTETTSSSQEQKTGILAEPSSLHFSMDKQFRRLDETGSIVPTESKGSSLRIEKFDRLAKCYQPEQQTRQVPDDRQSVSKQQTGQVPDDGQSVSEQQTGQVPDDRQSVSEQQTGQVPDDRQSVSEQQTGQVPDDRQSVSEQQTGQDPAQSSLRREPYTKTIADLKAEKLEQQAQLERLQQENLRLKLCNAQLKKQVTGSTEAAQKLRTDLESTQKKLKKWEEICQLQKDYLNDYKRELEKDDSAMQQMKFTIMELTERLRRHADESERKLREEKRKQEQLYRKMCEQYELKMKADRRVAELTEKLRLALDPSVRKPKSNNI